MRQVCQYLNDSSGIALHRLMKKEEDCDGDDTVDGDRKENNQRSMSLWMCCDTSEKWILGKEYVEGIMNTSANRLTKQNVAIVKGNSTSTDTTKTSETTAITDTTNTTDFRGGNEKTSSAPFSSLPSVGSLQQQQMNALKTMEIKTLPVIIYGNDGNSLECSRNPRCSFLHKGCKVFYPVDDLWREGVIDRVVWENEENEKNGEKCKDGEGEESSEDTRPTSDTCRRYAYINSVLSRSENTEKEDEELPEKLVTNPRSNKKLITTTNRVLLDNIRLPSYSAPILNLSVERNGSMIRYVFTTSSSETVTADEVGRSSSSSDDKKKQLFSYQEKLCERYRENTDKENVPHTTYEPLYKIRRIHGQWHKSNVADKWQHVSCVISEVEVSDDGNSGSNNNNSTMMVNCTLFRNGVVDGVMKWPLSEGKLLSPNAASAARPSTSGTSWM
jgi:hypothetical protein